MMSGRFAVAGCTEEVGLRTGNSGEQVATVVCVPRLRA
jgi:hypothetical protein